MRNILFFATIDPMFFNARPKGIFVYCTLISIVLLSSIILWLPFLLHITNWYGISIPDSSFAYIFKHYDGALYIIPAKTLYDPNLIDIPGKGFILSIPLSAGYFAAHFPLYPFFIRLFSIPFGFLKSMIVTNILFTGILACFFYYFLKKLQISKNPFLLTIVFLFLPRFLVVRSVGAPESLFILFIIASLYFFEKNKIFLAGLMGCLATITKLPGIILFIAYLAVFVERYLRHKKLHANYLYILLIPLGLISLFTFYYFQYHDFFAFFHTGELVPMGLPFSVFNSTAKWVGTAWLEDILFLFFINLYAVFSLRHIQYRSFFYFGIFFVTAALFTQHRDISRYLLPIWPLVVIAFEKLFTSKKFLIILLILLPAIYLYAWNFMINNIMPIADWKPFL